MEEWQPDSANRRVCLVFPEGYIMTDKRTDTGGFHAGRPAADDQNTFFFLNEGSRWATPSRQASGLTHSVSRGTNPGKGYPDTYYRQYTSGFLQGVLL